MAGDLNRSASVAAGGVDGHEPTEQPTRASRAVPLWSVAPRRARDGERHVEAERGGSRGRRCSPAAPAYARVTHASSQRPVEPTSGVQPRSCWCVLAAVDRAQVRRRPRWSVAAVPAAAAAPLPPLDCPACAVAGFDCVLLLDGRSETAPSWWPELPVCAGCCRSRSGTSQTAVVRRRCASCCCRLPPFLPPSLRPCPSLPGSLRLSSHHGRPGGSPALLQRRGHGHAGRTRHSHEDVSHMRGRRPVLLLDTSARGC